MQQARGLSPLPQGEDNDAQLFAQSRMLRIRQLNGLYLSIVVSTSPLRAVASIPLSDFHGVSRAGGPKGQLTKTRGCQTTHKSHKTTRIVGWIVGWDSLSTRRDPHTTDS